MEKILEIKHFFFPEKCESLKWVAIEPSIGQILKLV